MRKPLRRPWCSRHRGFGRAGTGANHREAAGDRTAERARHRAEISTLQAQLDHSDRQITKLRSVAESTLVLDPALVAELASQHARLETLLGNASRALERLGAPQKPGVRHARTDIDKAVEAVRYAIDATTRIGALLDPYR